MSYDLSERALLVGLEIRYWTARRHDKKVSREVALAHNSSERVGRYNKVLLPQDSNGRIAAALTKIISISGAARTEHYAQTLPWANDGARILTSENFIEWAAAMRSFNADFNQAATEFVAAYPALKEQAKVFLPNGLYKERDYPSPNWIADRFDFRTYILPLPSAGDFRVKLTGLQTDFIKDQIESKIQEQVTRATADLFSRLSDVVARVVNLGLPHSRLYNSLADDIRRVCAVARKLNLADDPDLNEFASRIEKELSFDPSFVRAVEGEKETLAARAEAIMGDMAMFMSPGDDDDE